MIDDPIALIDEYLAHREARDREILEAIAGGAAGVDAIVARVYAGLSPTLVAAAADSVRAHLVKLIGEGRLGGEWKGR
jgi:hypothetical protein